LLGTAFRPRADAAVGALADGRDGFFFAGSAAFAGGLAPRELVRRALAPLDFDSTSAAWLSAAGRFPGGLLVTTAVGRS
jgi:hypothetical protein